MDVVERLTLEAAQADTMLACEHRHRYEFAAGLCDGRRVLDLCCGSGYGTAILAGHAHEVVGVDNDAATIETARVTVGRQVPNVSFELADAVAFLRSDIGGRFDIVVCFAGLEYLQALDHALALLREHAERGLRIVASVPNGGLLGEQNTYHVTEFGYDEAIEAFAPFPSTLMVPQFLAEGSLICPSDAQQTEVTVTLEDRDEPEYANHFIFCVGFEPEEVQRTHHGRIQLNASPLFNRWAEDLKRGAWALRRENARLARARLGKAGSAASSALAGLADREAQIAALQHRCRLAEARVRELEAALAGMETLQETPLGPAEEAVEAVEAPPEPAELTAAAIDPDEDPNSWEHRRCRAADFLIPWIEQTVPLAGKTVLEYGCGNAAISCAFAERAESLIGVDIDAAGIEFGNNAVRERHLDNVKLELHTVDSILDAVAARRGEVDVFLCYAVLEHLTIAERLAVLRLARDVVKPDGAIVVCGAPNRLIYFDHTAQMPFFHLLPDQLAVEYFPRSPRQDFRSALAAAVQKGPEDALEAIVRLGRGVSFHEFEVVFGDLSRHVIASNYDPLLFAERPVHPDEVILARYLDRWRPDLAPVWSRYWLDLILSPRPVQRRPSFLRPWTAQTLESSNVAWSQQESLYLQGRDSTLWATLPQPTNRVVIGAQTNAGELKLHVRGETMDAPLTARIAGKQRDGQAFASFVLPVPQQRLALSASEACSVVFVGYED